MEGKYPLTWNRSLEMSRPTEPEYLTAGANGCAQARRRLIINLYEHYSPDGELAVQNDAAARVC